MPETLSLIPFSYQVTFLTMADGARLVQTVTVAGDSDFHLHKLTASFNTATVNVWFVQLRDTGSGRALSNGLVGGNTLFGTGQQPYILPAPYVFLAGGGVEVDVQNNNGAVQTFYLTLSGVKALRGLR